MTRRTLPILLTATLLFTCSALAQSPPDTSRPVRPGQPGLRPFWNAHSTRFLYAPSFDVPTTPGATAYRFTLLDHAGQSHTFVAPEPTAPLSPIWNGLPEGHSTLTLQPLDPAGKDVGSPTQRIFYRAAPFPGEPGPPPIPYVQAGRTGLKALFDAPHVQHWLTDPNPDPSYPLYCYPNKVIGGLTRAMAAYAATAESPADRTAALRIARAAADYLLTLRLADPSPFAHIPPTYALNVDKPLAVAVPRVKNHWLMVPSAIDAAFGLLDVYDASHDPKYLDAARAIADTLVKTQAPDGTWSLMVDDRTGNPVNPQRQIPTWIIFFFDRLDRQYHLDQYRPARGRAWDWIVANPLKTYQWDAQFEDVQLRDPYVNLAREQACDTATLLLTDPAHTPDDLAQADELLRYAEDQFVVWSPIEDPADWHNPDGRPAKTAPRWITPCVLEQYACYEPVARSCAILINAYCTAHTVTGNPLYLAKAHALANGMLAGQAKMIQSYAATGEIPTWNMDRKPSNWLNNSFYAAQALLNLAAHDTPQ